jgi:hypothetical protein
VKHKKTLVEDEIVEQEEKSDSSGPKPSAEPTSPVAIIRKELDLPGGVRSGNVPIVPSSDPEAPLGRDDEGRPIRKMKSDREILNDLRETHRAEKEGKKLCGHNNNIETCSFGAGTKRRPIVLGTVKSREEKSPPAVTAERLAAQYAKPRGEKNPSVMTAEQLSAQWNLKPKGQRANPGHHSIPRFLKIAEARVLVLSGVT